MVSGRGLRRLVSALMLAVAAFCGAGIAHAEGAGSVAWRDRPTRFLWVPGSARAIPASLSASRDVGLVAIQLSPYLSAASGGDLALFGVELPRMTLRFGLFGMMELEGSDPIGAGSDGFAGIFPADAVILWRGQYGTSLSFSLDAEAARVLPPGGVLELTLSFRHESVHFTGDAEERGERWAGVVDLGEFLMLDVSARIPVRRVDLEVRAQVKCFMPRRGSFSYTYGPGLDVVALWHVHDRVQPFFSFFFEYLFGSERMSYRDNYLMRSLLGAMFPGRGADVSLYLALALGHGKGLLALHEAFLLGGGLRFAWPPRERTSRFSRRRPEGAITTAEAAIAMTTLVEAAR